MIIGTNNISAIPPKPIKTQKQQQTKAKQQLVLTIQYLFNEYVKAASVI